MQLETQKQLSEDFFHGRSVDITQDLLGKLLVNEENGTAGLVVETEAYLGKADPSCHFAKSGEARKQVFRKGAGTVYVYIIHGHHCMNFISEYRCEPEGILIRAVEPVEGVEKMKELRGWEDERKLASGPGKLTEALNIRKEKYNGEKLPESSLSLYETGRELEVETSARIGIKEAKDWPCRFLVKDSDYVSEAVREPDHYFDFRCVYSEF